MFVLFHVQNLSLALIIHSLAALGQYTKNDGNFPASA